MNWKFLGSQFNQDFFGVGLLAVAFTMFFERVLGLDTPFPSAIAKMILVKSFPKDEKPFRNIEKPFPDIGKQLFEAKKPRRDGQNQVSDKSLNMLADNWTAEFTIHC